MLENCFKFFFVCLVQLSNFWNKYMDAGHWTVVTQYIRGFSFLLLWTKHFVIISVTIHNPIKL